VVRPRAICWCILVVTTLALTTLGARSASGEDVDALAERAYQAGYRALRAGDCHTALAHYRRSYDLAPRPRTIFNIGVCQEEIGQHGPAWQSYREFLRTAEARDSEIVERARERLELLRTRLRGRAFVDSTPSGATVYLDDERQPRGTTPLGLVLEPGAHRLRIAAANGTSTERELEVVPDGVATLSIELAAPATITIDVEPADAVITPIDGGTPKTGTLHDEVASGRHHFVIRRAGYAPRDVIIDAAPGRAHIERVVLRSLTAPARIHVVRPPDAAVTLDRSPLTLRMREVAAGTHDLTVRAPGHYGYRGAIAADAGEDVTITVDLAPRRSPTRVWGLTAAGTSALVAAGTLGVLALRDVTSPNAVDHDRGKTRALVADGLFVVGAGALYLAWRARTPTAATVRIDRFRRSP
jgi:hypothetical protein